MKSWILFGGTTEGRLLAEAFAKWGQPAVVCVTSEYGASLLPESTFLDVRAGRLDPDGMKRLFREVNPEWVIDATHPYASEVTANLRKVCREEMIPYLRVRRQLSDFDAAENAGELPEHSAAAMGNTCRKTIIMVHSAAEAAEHLKGTEGGIFLTTGSKELKAFAAVPEVWERCYARVLPTVQVLEECIKLRLPGKRLIMMQGPFSMELNYVMLKDTGSRWLVTKKAGKAGGFREKWEAAEKAGCGLVIIEPPDEGGTDEGGTDDERTMGFAEAAEFLKQQCRR